MELRDFVKGAASDSDSWLAVRMLVLSSSTSESTTPSLFEGLVVLFLGSFCFDGRILVVTTRESEDELELEEDSVSGGFEGEGFEDELELEEDSIGEGFEGEGG